MGLPALLPERPEVPRVGLNQEALPAEVSLQVERVAQLLPVVRAGLHEHSAALGREKGREALVERSRKNARIILYEWVISNNHFIDRSYNMITVHCQYVNEN